ncbi:MAG TPA: SDR family oxidoreductase [bacterium]|nr:SDR family oxidoreductase [bacterium]
MGTPATASNCYFMTGGTGSLGREVIGRVLERDARARVVVLVRAPAEIEARLRLEELHSYLRNYFGTENTSHLHFVRGNINSPCLGMDRVDYFGLTQQVTHVIHCAASINLGDRLVTARRINVEGTEEVLRFARRCPRLAVLSHISTAYVAGDRNGLIRETELDRSQHFLNAYEQSKFEAERLVQAATSELPILVFRPSIIVGDSIDGHLSCLSTIYPPLHAAVRGWIRIVPRDPNSRLDLVPVDYVAHAIACLTTRPLRLGATYHLASGWSRSIPVEELVANTLQFFEKDRTSAAVSPNQAPSFRRREGRRMRVFLDYLSSRKDFEDCNARGDLGVIEPANMNRVLPNLLAYCQTSSWGAIQPWIS